MFVENSHGFALFIEVGAIGCIEQFVETFRQCPGVRRQVPTVMWLEFCAAQSPGN
jgi:hypothetical protein